MAVRRSPSRQNGSRLAGSRPPDVPPTANTNAARAANTSAPPEAAAEANPAMAPTASGSRRSRMVACPKCGTSVEWRSDNRFRPFCSERCRLIDLGAWASEDYRVPDKVKPMDESGE